MEQQIFDYFNTIAWKDVWTADYLKEFKNNYTLLANSMAKPVLDRINNSDVRKKIKTIIGASSIEIDKNTEYDIFTTEGYISWKEPVRKFSLDSSIDFSCKNILNESAIENMITRLAATISIREKVYVDYVESIGLLDKATLYVFKDYEPIYDLSLPKAQRIGFFGWEEMAIIVEDENGLQ